MLIAYEPYFVHTVTYLNLYAMEGKYDGQHQKQKPQAQKLLF